MPADSTIERVEVWRLHGRMPVERDPQQPAPPIDVYGEWRPRTCTLSTEAEPGELPVSHSYLRLVTRGGHEGLYCGISELAVRLLDGLVPARLLGRDALDAAQIWQAIYRSPRHQTRGMDHVMLSAIDIAIWDLRGKYFGVPAATLLGGVSRRTIPAYGSVLNLPGSDGSDEASLCAWAVRLRDAGYRFQKWFFPFGDEDRSANLGRQEALAAALRGALGQTADFILCIPGPFTRRAKALFRAVEPYRPMHIQVSAELGTRELLAETRQQSTIPIGTGQGIQDRWELSEYLAPRCVDCLGYDPDKGGGLTELHRMSVMAETYGLTVYPHAGLPTNLHLAAALPPSLCPMVEYLLTWMPHRLFFEDHDFTPCDGAITLPAYPGIFRWSEERIERRELVRAWTL
jgi:L-alanine-DL-glutamate epimerase-like enolase superfamily enzyme